MEYNKRVKTKAADDFRNRRRNAKHSNADEKLGILNKLLGKKFDQEMEMNKDSIRMKKSETIKDCIKHFRDSIATQNLGTEGVISKASDLDMTQIKILVRYE